MRFKLASTLLICFFLTGCAHIYGKQGVVKSRSDNEYLNYDSKASLKLPADLDKPASQNYYPVPQANGAKPTQAVSIDPPGAGLNNIQQKRTFFQKVAHWF